MLMALLSNAVVPNWAQVCNLVWSRNVNEIVSTHGYSQNQARSRSCKLQPYLSAVQPGLTLSDESAQQ